MSKIAQIISDSEWDLIAKQLAIPPRQVQIIQAIMAGCNKPEAIALALGIQPSSVKTHIERLYQNLGVHDRVEVVVRVFVELLKIREKISVSSAELRAD